MNNNEMEHVMYLYHNGTPEERSWAIGEVVNKMEKYVNKMYWSHFNAFPNEMEDIISVGKLAIIEKLGEYNPSKGTPTTYFTLHILHEMYKYVTNYVYKTTDYYGSMIKKYVSLSNNLAVKGYSQKFLSPEEFSELAKKELGATMPAKTIKECMLIMTRNENVNIHEPANEYLFRDTDYDISFEDFIIETMIKDDSNERIVKAFNSLKPDEQTVLYFRYCVDKPKKISEIAELIGKNPYSKLRKATTSFKMALVA